jgi:hypothetical protein
VLADRRPSQCLPQLQSTLPDNRLIQTEDYEKGVKELSDAYLESAAEFSAMLKERTPGEIAYDSEVVAGLRRGLSILKELELAKEKYPG